MDYTKAGLWDSIKKLVKVCLWVGGAAIVNELFQKATGFRFHDVTVYGIVLNAELLNLFFTAFLNGTGAGFVKWITTKAEEAK